MYVSMSLAEVRDLSSNSPAAAAAAL